jgi:ATP-binding cassette subfamily F protein 3
MPIIALNNVAKLYGTRVLLENVSVTVNAGDRIGVVGPNGVGKTSLLRLMAGAMTPSRGEVHIARSTRVGFLAQEPDFTAHGTVFEAALSAFVRIHELEAGLADLHERVAANPTDAGRLLRRQGELEHEFERIGGYTYHQRAEAVLGGMGFHGDDLVKPTDRLSGGERSRLAIAHLLLQDADVLLLDEPTNHLDVDGLEWLEGFLAGFPGAAVVVSHDRHFLDTFSSRILDIDGAEVDLYKGNYSDYVTQKAEKIARQRKLYDQQQTRIAKEADFIQRYIASTRGGEARGRRKRLERMERIERPTESRRRIAVRIEPAVRGGNEVLNLEGVGKEFDGRRLFGGLTLQVLRGERIGVVGPNGAGKTTLLRLIVGEQEPTAGVVRVGHNIQVGYYRQDRSDLRLNQTVLDEVWSRAPQSLAGEMRSMLGMFLFSDNDCFKKVGDLSGGEQARVALAKLILSAPNFLLLDEPTNHLDIPSRLALEDALDAYEGTVLIVSHDRYVLDRVADKILEIKDGHAKVYLGGYSRYVEQAHAAVAKAQAAKAREKRAAPRPPSRRAAARRKARPVAVLEPMIFEREETVKTLQHAMSDPEIYKSPETVRSLTAQLGTVRQELAALYDEWDEASEQG